MDLHWSKHQYNPSEPTCERGYDKTMDHEVLKLGKAQYLSASGFDQLRRDENGFARLTPTAKRVDEQVSSLTTDISSLEEKLKRYRAEKEKAVKYQKSDEYKESKKKDKKKKQKRERNELLEMVFNNADRMVEEELEDSEDEAYRDLKKGSRPKRKDTLDTTYGKRFSPVVSMLYDSINDFDKIARDISEELDTPQLRGKTMYRSTQIGNLISARNSKLSAVKELASVATTISNLEYKKDKDRKAEEGSDSSKAISSLGAKFLRGGMDTVDDKKKKKEKKSSSSKKFASYYGDNSDDDDDDSGSIKKSSSRVKDSDEADDRELAAELAKALGRHKDIKFTAHERYASLDGSYTVMVTCDPLDPDNTAKFVAVDKKGKIIPGFKDDYPGLLPKRKNCKFVFDIGRKRVQDKNSGRTYKLLFTD